MTTALDPASHPVDSIRTMRRSLRLLAATALATVFAAPAAHAAQVPGLGSWDRGAQHAVRIDGLMANHAGGGFGGAQPLTSTALATGLTALGAHVGLPAVTVGNGDVTVVRLDRKIDEQLGLADVAKTVQGQAADAGLNPPEYFGSEVVARMLGLRTDHPYGTDRLELDPLDVVTRAEAAWSFSQAWKQGTGGAAWVRQQLAALVLPKYTAAQKTVLRIAVSKIGMPYVWGGESDGTTGIYGPQAHGGYDCSGFVWRVFKVSGLPWGAEIQGRTAAQMAAEIPRSARLRYSQLKPTDLVFFGKTKLWQRVTEAGIWHTAIVFAPGWVIESSGQGVALAPFASGWKRNELAFGRRLL